MISDGLDVDIALRRQMRNRNQCGVFDTRKSNERSTPVAYAFMQRKEAE